MTREEVIRTIVAMESRGDSLGERVVCEQTSELYASACEHFATWDTALRYAGVHRRPPSKQPYTPERVLSKLRDLCLRGYDLSSGRAMTRHRQLYEAARLHFGSWRQALCAVGLRLESAHTGSRIPRLDKAEIIAAVHERQRTGLSLAYSSVCLEDHDLAVMAKRQFGSWRRALIAAGLAATTEK